MTKLQQIYNKVMTVLWSTYDFSKIGPLTSSTTRDLMHIQHNKFYWISNRSGVAELIWTVTTMTLVWYFR